MWHRIIAVDRAHWARTTRAGVQRVYPPGFLGYLGRERDRIDQLYYQLGLELGVHIFGAHG